jgi:hypothetical protein
LIDRGPTSTQRLSTKLENDVADLAKLKALRRHMWAKARPGTKGKTTDGEHFAPACFALGPDRHPVPELLMVAIDLGNVAFS